MIWTPFSSILDPLSGIPFIESKKVPRRLEMTPQWDSRFGTRNWSFWTPKQNPAYWTSQDSILDPLFEKSGGGHPYRSWHLKQNPAYIPYDWTSQDSILDPIFIILDPLSGIFILTLYRIEKGAQETRDDPSQDFHDKLSKVGKSMKFRFSGRKNRSFFFRLLFWTSFLDLILELQDGQSLWIHAGKYILFGSSFVTPFWISYDFKRCPGD